jgi:hypothetical protein
MTSPALAQVKHSSDYRITASPTGGEIVTATAGDPIYTVEATPVSVTTDQHIEIAHKVSYGNFMKGTVTIPSDAKFTRVDGYDGVYACTHQNVLFGYRANSCLYDKDGDGKFELFAYSKGDELRQLKEPVPYKTVSSSSATVGYAFRSVVTYLGSDGNSINLSYREFYNNYARPAFTEELKLPLMKAFPQQMRFKGTTINVLGVDGSGIRYAVVSSPPSAVPEAPPSQ